MRAKRGHYEYMYVTSKKEQTYIHIYIYKVYVGDGGKWVAKDNFFDVAHPCHPFLQRVRVRVFSNFAQFHTTWYVPKVTLYVENRCCCIMNRRKHWTIWSATCISTPLWKIPCSYKCIFFQSVSQCFHVNKFGNFYFYKAATVQ
jgi:hypothetical protein